MQTTKFQKRLFGTNGVRGIVGKDPTPDLVLTIGEALGTMRKGCIAVGRDTRTSGETLVRAVKSGLLATGCDVVDCGILPTPALQYLIKEQFDGGAMITASHNPPEYNGVKIIEADGTEMGDEETLKLEQLIFDPSFSPQSWEHIGHETNAPYLIREYIGAIVNQFPEKVGSEISVVVDPGSGPACLTTPQILTEMGCRVFTVNGVMDGTFPGRLPEPSSEGLKGLAELVVSSGAAFGVAHDGDADRAVFIDEKGRFVEENREFALIAQHICHQKKGTLVTPVRYIPRSRDGGEKRRLHNYLHTGWKYLRCTNYAISHREWKRGCIWRRREWWTYFPRSPVLPGWGYDTAMMVFILASTGQKLSTLVNALPKRFMIKDKISTSLGTPVLESLKKVYSQDSLDLTDGVKILRENSWALVRTFRYRTHNSDYYRCGFP